MILGDSCVARGWGHPRLGLSHVGDGKRRVTTPPAWALGRLLFFYLDRAGAPGQLVGTSRALALASHWARGFQPHGARRWWLTPVIPATQEAEIMRIEVQSQPRQIVCETLSRENLHKKKKKRLVEWRFPRFVLCHLSRIALHIWLSRLCFCFTW
jgi:hypothetical protein